MNGHQLPFFRTVRPFAPSFRLACTAAIIGAFAPSSHTQEEEDIFELSPFTVTGEDDQGYRATSTLSGSRLRTPLEDIGAAVSVVTDEFLKDTNSTNLRDVLVYTTGTEVSGIGGNFSDAGLDGNNKPIDRAVSNSTGTRVRGLASATQTRGYFRSSIPFDSYNSSRLEINRGANAILFGIGSPAGIINYTPKLAHANQESGSFTAQYGQFGSVRFSVDYNKPVIEDKLAFRIALLDDDSKFQQKPAFNHEKRAYIAGVYSPELFSAEDKTTFRFNYEKGDIEANNPRTLPPEDRLTTWFEPSPIMQAAGITPKATHDPREPFAAGNGVTVAQNLNRSAIVFFPDHNSPLPSDPLADIGGQSDLVGRQWVISRGRPDGGTVAHLMPAYLGDALRRMGLSTEATFYRTPTLKDRSVFDYRNNLIDGDNKRENTDFDALNVSFEQLFLNDRVGFELAYDDQKVTNDRQALMQTDSVILSLDVNTHLLSGEPNPNFGRPMAITGGVDAAWGESERETKRATAFAELDFGEVLDADWSHWLGRHILTGLYQDEETYSESRGGDPWYIPDEFPYANSQNRFSDSGKRVRLINYLGPSIADATTAAGANIPRIHANRMDMAGLTQNGHFLLQRQSAGSEPEFVPLNIVNARRDLADNASGANKTLRIIESQAINLQSYLLQNNLVLSAGWRTEDVENYRAAAPVSPDGQNHRLVDDPSYAFEDTPDLEVDNTLFSWSAVAKTPDSWLKELPLINGLSFHFNESENFSPPSGLRFSPFGEQLLPPTGETEDYGFSIEFADRKAVARVNWYETTQSLNTNGGVTGAVNSIISIHSMAFDAVTTGFAQDRGDGFPVNYVDPPQFLLDLYNVEINNGSLNATNPGIAATGDFVSKGVEAELFLNLTDNWTLTLNAAKQESVRSNTGDDAAKLLFETQVEGGGSIIDNWLDSGQLVPLFITATDPNTGEVIPDSSGTVSDWARRTIVNPFNNVRLQDGAPAQELRKWRFNAVTNYSFTDGALTGFNLGGAYRWQDRVAIGFPLTTAPDGETIIDVTNPYYGPREDSVDLWIGYQRPIFNDRVDWKLQLNLRNAFGSPELVPVFSQPDGTDAIFRIGESRAWTLTSTFNF